MYQNQNQKLINPHPSIAWHMHCFSTHTDWDLRSSRPPRSLVEWKEQGISRCRPLHGRDLCGHSFVSTCPKEDCGLSSSYSPSYASLTLIHFLSVCSIFIVIGFSWRPGSRCLRIRSSLTFWVDVSKTSNTRICRSWRQGSNFARFKPYFR